MLIEQHGNKAFCVRKANLPAGHIAISNKLSGSKDMTALDRSIFVALIIIISSIICVVDFVCFARPILCTFIVCMCYNLYFVIT